MIDISLKKTSLNNPVQTFSSIMTVISEQATSAEEDRTENLISSRHRRDSESRTVERSTEVWRYLNKSDHLVKQINIESYF